MSPQAARGYVRKGRELLVEAVAPQDRAFMFAQVLAGLQQDRLDAKEAGNISAQVGASKAMVNHLKQIAHIDPMRFEQVTAASDPKVYVKKHAQELSSRLLRQQQQHIADKQYSQHDFLAVMSKSTLKVIM